MGMRDVTGSVLCALDEPEESDDHWLRAALRERDHTVLDPVAPAGSGSELDASGDDGVTKRGRTTDAVTATVASASPTAVVVDDRTVDVPAVVDACDEIPVFALVPSPDRAASALDAGARDVYVDGGARDAGVGSGARDAGTEGGPRESAFVERVVDAVERDTYRYWFDRYRALVDAVGDGLYQADADGVFEIVNPSHAELTGYSRDELEGGHVSQFMNEESFRKGTEVIQEILSTPGKRRGRFQFENETGRGDVKVGEINMTVVSEDEAGFDGSVGVMRDVTERVRRTEALERQNERLDEFASVVSHDLRNPLNVIDGHLQLAKAGDEDALDVVEEELERVNTLLGELLSLAREGKVVDDPESVAFEDVVRAAWDGVESADATLSVVEPVGTIEVDPSRFRELLENLFRNAIEHAGETVAVEVGATKRGFYVADDGPGLPGDDPTQVFERGFTTADSGTGFGLDIVCQITEAHDWRVHAGNSDAGGARFEFDLDPIHAGCGALQEATE